MTAKEKVLTTLSRASADNVPIDYDVNPGIDACLKAHFGLKPNDSEGLRKVLGVDFRGVGVSYAGPRLHEDIPALGVKVNMSVQADAGETR